MNDKEAAEVLETLLDYFRSLGDAIDKTDEQALTQAITRLEASPWISVEEPPEEEHTDWLVYYRQKLNPKSFPKMPYAYYMTESSYYNGGFELDEDEGKEVTHYCPMPIPPTNDTQEGGQNDT